MLKESVPAIVGVCLALGFLAIIQVLTSPQTETIILKLF